MKFGEKVAWGLVEGRPLDQLMSNKMSRVKVDFSVILTSN